MSVFLTERRGEMEGARPGHSPLRRSVSRFLEVTPSRKLTGRGLRRLLVLRFRRAARARWWRGSLFFSTLLHLLVLTIVLTTLQHERAARLPEIAWEIAAFTTPDEMEIAERLPPLPAEEPLEEREPDAPVFEPEPRDEADEVERPSDPRECAVDRDRLRLPEASMPRPPRIEMASAVGKSLEAEAPPSLPEPAVPAVITTAKPTAGSTPAPRYPRLARKKGWEGFVTLAVEVDAAGAVVAVTIASSSGHDQLDRAALEAVRRWRFEPGRRNGFAIASRTEVTIEFRLR